MGVSSSTNRSTYHLRDDNNTKLCMMATSDMTNSSVSFGPCPQGFSVMKKKNGVRSFEGGDTMKEWKTVKGTGKRGPCPDAADYGFQERFSNKTAIAPTASISIICGGTSPGVEPIAANSYTHKTLSGSFNVKNKYLKKLLAKH